MPSWLVHPSPIICCSLMLGILAFVSRRARKWPSERHVLEVIVFTAALLGSVRLISHMLINVDVNGDDEERVIAFAGAAVLGFIATRGMVEILLSYKRPEFEIVNQPSDEAA